MADHVAERAKPALVTTFGWWALTIFTLVIVDDLTFGPLFWVGARLVGQIPTFIAALVIYTSAQIILVARATSETPGKIASWLLSRLQLERKNVEVAQREASLHRRAASATGAIAITPLIGGVLPPLLLHRTGASTSFVRKLSFATAPIYALEFAFLHGWIPGAF
jgi:hypothetical protein